MYPYDWQRSIVVATHLIAAAIIVGAMYWARAVLIPFALAVLLTLVLAPLVGAIQRIGIGRVPAAVLVVVLASSLVLGVGWIVTRQFVELAYELPAYSDTIKSKIRDVKEMATSPATGRIGKLISEVTAEFQSPADPPAPSVAAPAKNAVSVAFHDASGALVKEAPPMLVTEGKCRTAWARSHLAAEAPPMAPSAALSKQQLEKTPEKFRAEDQAFRKLLLASGA